MSDLDNAITSINSAAARTNVATDFVDDLSTFDENSNVTNANNGKTVGSFSKQIKTLYTNQADPFFTQAQEDIDEAIELLDGNAIPDLKSAALAAGTTYDNITYSTNLVDEIKGYIFDADAQITYAVPEAAQGKFISIVVGSTLTTSDSSSYHLEDVSDAIKNKVAVSANLFGALSINTSGFSDYDSSPNIQACEDWIASQSESAPGSGVGSTTIYTMTLEKGVYLIGSTIKTGSHCLYDFNRSVLYEPTMSIPIIDTVGYRTTFKNIIFDGGLNHVRVIGPNADTMINTLDGCEHRAVGDVGIFHDTSVNHGPSSGNPRNGFSMHQIITNFKTYRHSFIRSACDGTTIDGGWAQFRPFMNGENAGAGDQYWANSLTGPLVAKNVLGVSVNDGGADDLSFWFKSGDDNNPNESELQIDRFRCGEGGSAIIKAVNCKRVVLTNSPIFGRSGNQYAWMEIYNRIPSIEVKNCEGWVDSLGVMIDSDTIPSVTDYLNLTRDYELSIDIRNNVDSGHRSNQIVHSTRAEYKSGGLTTPLINSIFEQFSDTAQSTPNQRGENFANAGTFAYNQGSLSNANLVGTSSTGTDSSTGYSMEIRTASADGAQYGRTMNGWGTSVPEGVYSYSMMIKTSKSMVLVLSKNGVSFKRIIIPASDSYIRYSGSFYHDGDSASLTMQLQTIPIGTVFSCGMMQVSAGDSPTIYQMSGNEFNQFIPVVTYGNAPPSAGFHKRGDRHVNTEPSAGGYDGWRCVSGNNTGVGTWKGYGLIEA